MLPFFIIYGGNMRLDKYLKNSRLIKRRTIAKEACEQGKVLVNERVAKPGLEVKVGDEISMTFGQRTQKVKVTAILDHATKENARDMYEEI